MHIQRLIIKSLLIIIAIQVGLFISYFIYKNHNRKESSDEFSLPPIAVIVNEKKDIVPPKSKDFDSPKKIHLVKGIEFNKKIKRIAPKTSDDIVAINNSRVQPILYTKSVPLSSLSIPEKKRKFIDMMIPSILVAKHQMRLDKERVASLIIKHDISAEDKKWLEDKRKEFHASDNYELYDKMELHPTSIVIAQAIVESGWGTSKFFQKANNVFGVWSFSESDARLPASKKRGKRRVYLKKYKSMEESIYDYFVTIARKDCYKVFQKQRLLTQDPYELVNYLIKYSERGESYTKEIKEMIRNNKLSAYDKYELDL